MAALSSSCPSLPLSLPRPPIFFIMAGMGSNPAFSEKLISLSLQNQIHMMTIDDMVGLFSAKTRKGACLLHEHRVDMVDNIGGMPD